VESIATPSGAAPAYIEAVDGLSRLLGWAGAGLVGAMLAIICYDVTLRYAFNAPTSWSTEIATYMLVAMAFVTAAWAQRQGAHIRVALLVERLRGEARLNLELIGAWVGFAFLAFLAWQTVVMSYDNWLNGVRIFSLLNTPVYLPQIPVAVGLAAFAFAMLADIHRLRPPAGWRGWAGASIVPAAALGLLLMGMRPPKALGTTFDWGSILLTGALLAVCWLWSGRRVAVFVFLVLAALGLAFGVSLKGGTIWIVATQVVVTLVVLCLGVRISLALGLIGMLGVYFLLPSPTPITLAERGWESVNSFTLTAVPMFVLMGALLLRSGLSDMVFDALAKWLGRFPGGLAHAGIGACGVFAAVSGSSIATAATMGIVACPEMIRRGYSPRLAYGSIAAGGTLGILIPPSIPMIIYGSTTGAPIATLFIAGIIPGILLVIAFMGLIFAWATLDRRAAPPADDHVSWPEKFAALLQVLPILAMVGVVLGVLYAGVATPSEAGALGAAAALLVCLARRKLSVHEFGSALLETAKVSSFLFVIVVGASILTYGFDYLRLPALLVDTVREAQFEPWLIMIAISVVYIILGMFLDSISMMVMTLPVMFPLIVSVGFDPVWFGVILVILLEIGLITPPVGVNLFVLRGFSGATPLKEIAIGAIPFAVIMTAFLVVFYLLPDLVTWLPRQMM